MKKINLIKYFNIIPSSYRLFIGLILLIPIALYIYRFTPNSLSGDIRTWSDFAGFFQLSVSILNVLVVVILSIIIVHVEEERHIESEAFETKITNQQLDFQKILEKPVIVFQRKSSQSTYIIYNYGKGVALNILVAYKSTDNGNWEEPVRCYSLIQGGEPIELNWKLGGHIWGASYTDVFGTEYTTLCQGEVSRQIQGNQLVNINESDISWLADKRRRIIVV